MNRQRLDPTRVAGWLAARQGLGAAPYEGDVASLTARLVALHATDPASIHLAVHARRAGDDIATTAEDVARALETSRKVVRWLCMRRTLHVIPADLVPVALAIYRARLLPTSEKRLHQMLVRADVCAEADVAAVLADIGVRLRAALAADDAHSTALAERIPELQASFPYLPDKPYGGRIALGSHLLGHFGVAGSLVRAQVQGGWRSGRCAWSSSERWLGYDPCIDVADPHDATAELVRAYLGAFGPAGLEDVVWWTGLPKGWVRKALDSLGAEVAEVDVGAWPAPQLVLRAALEPLRAPNVDERPPRAVLLPALDPTIMGYRWRDRFLDPAFTAHLFDRNGNAGPTVWWRDRVIGAWAQRKQDGEVVWKLLEEVPEAEDAVAEAAASLTRALGEERVAPRFPAPLQRKLQG